MACPLPPAVRPRPQPARERGRRLAGPRATRAAPRGVRRQGAPAGLARPGLADRRAHRGQPPPACARGLRHRCDRRLRVPEPQLDRPRAGGLRDPPAPVVDAEGHAGPADRQGRGRDSEAEERRRARPRPAREVRLEGGAGGQRAHAGRARGPRAPQDAPGARARPVGARERAGDRGRAALLEGEGRQGGGARPPAPRPRRARHHAGASLRRRGGDGLGGRPPAQGRRARRLRGGRAAARAARHAAALPGPRLLVARVPGTVRLWRLSRRRHGPGQDGAGAGPHREELDGGSAAADLAHLPDVGDRELGEGSRALYARPAPPRPSRRRAREGRAAGAGEPPRHRHLELCAAPPRPGGPQGGRLGGGGARRSAEHQEPRDQAGPRRPRDPSGVAHRPDRDARREQRGRTPRCSAARPSSSARSSSPSRPRATRTRRRGSGASPAPSSCGASRPTAASSRTCPPRWR